MQSENLNELFQALSKAQGLIKGAAKDSKNPFFKSNYADLESVWAVIREPFAANGLSVIQTPGYKDGFYTLTTMLCHSSGQYLGDTVSLPLAKADSQSLGSAITYMRRYALAAIAGVYQTDDDGNQATHPPVQHKPIAPIAPTAPFPSDDLVPMFDDMPNTHDVANELFDTKDDDDYIITFGKFKGASIKSIPLKDLVNYAKWLRSDGSKPLIKGSPSYEFCARVDRMAR